MGSELLACVLLLASVGCKHDPRRGGTRLTFTVTSSDPEKIQDVAASMRERLDEKTQPADVRVDGERVIVSLAPLDPEILEHIKKVLVRTAHLELHLTDDDAPYTTTLAALAAAVPELQVGADHVITARSGEHKAAPAWARAHDCRSPTCLVRGDTVLAAQLFGDRDLGVTGVAQPPPADHQVAYGRMPDDKIWRAYYLSRTAELDGEQIAHVEHTFDPTSRASVIDVRLQPDGARAYADLSARAVGRTLAIVLDGTVVAIVPIARAVTDGHPVFQLAGAGEDLDRRSNELALAMRVGSLPRFQLTSEATIE